MEPGVKGLGIPKPPQVPPCPDERLLHGILRGIPVTEDPPSDRVQAVVCGSREDIEGLVVTPLCAFDEFGRHADPLKRCGHLPHSQGMSLAAHRILQIGKPPILGQRAAGRAARPPKTSAHGGPVPRGVRRSDPLVTAAHARGAMSPFRSQKCSDGGTEL